NGPDAVRRRQGLGEHPRGAAVRRGAHDRVAAGGHAAARGLGASGANRRGADPLGSLAVSDELGRGGRPLGRRAPWVVAAGYAAEIGHARRLARAMSRADLAHAVALVEGGAVGGDEASALITGLLELDAIPPEEFPWRSELGDAFNSREHELRARVGP